MTVRCLLAMMGTDVHNKGIRTLAQLLRDRGMEVIYLGEHNTAAGIVSAVNAEDPDVVGLSFSTASYVHYTRQLLAEMRAAGVDDVPVMLGGLIHADDEPELRAAGVAGIFGPGSTIDQIIEFIESRAAAGRDDRVVAGPSTDPAR